MVTILGKDGDAIGEQAVFELLRTAEEAASLDVLFEALADSRRRHVLSILLDRPTPLDVETLARAVAAREAVATAADPPDDVVRRVQVSLHHVHLPKLADTGVVEYDYERGAVAVGEEMDAVSPLAGE
ncbi:MULTISPECIES: DUF7344 domain-containing protein [Halorussus]|uniref:DUF7344 domain-containing protein n=1 Tax=Halorussus TaxID=1070314 RepID=UPI0020A20AE0|nr:hypothetical protein [Halorussus vallis]USZ78412.1 hypothetical protein NGM07_23100 [Halorussus vallis]